MTRESDALDLEGGMFTLRDPRNMLTFYINCGGKNLPENRKRVLEQAKVELRRAFGRA